LTHKASDIAGYLKKGYFGYKIWHAPYYRVLKDGEKGIKYIDDPAHESVFAAMEKAGMIGASVHIADPNGPFGDRGEWCTDPVEYWREIMGIERVLQRHPNLVIVAAHGCWLVCQDAQLDFLRYMFKTYPNFYVDLAATDQYYNLVNRENLRDLFIEYSDHILFGTDVATFDNSAIPNYITRYTCSFQILETEDLVESTFFGSKPTKGLNLPKEVLEKIYYKNAMKLYPGLLERMRRLGYKV
jgi:predicted TIM-barrel fold metal-dependent hydrolase